MCTPEPNRAAGQSGSCPPNLQLPQLDVFPTSNPSEKRTFGGARDAPPAAGEAGRPSAPRVARCPRVRSLSGQAIAHGIENLSSRGKNPQCRQRAAINHCVAVHKHLELPIVPVHHVDFSLQLATKPRRHTDGVQPGDSVRTITNGDATHHPLLTTIGELTVGPTDVAYDWNSH